MQAHKPTAVAVSALLTTAMPMMGEMVEAPKET